jgi:hypothetical protein
MLPNIVLEIEILRYTITVMPSFWKKEIIITWIMEKEG